MSASENLPLSHKCPKTCRKFLKEFWENFWEILRKLLRNAQEYFATREKFWKTVKNECFGKISYFVINVQNPQKIYEKLWETENICEKFWEKVCRNSEEISEKFPENFWEILRNIWKIRKTVENECFGKMSHFSSMSQNLQKIWENCCRNSEEISEKFWEILPPGSWLKSGKINKFWDFKPLWIRKLCRV